MDRTRTVALAAVIGGMYFVLTVLLAPISFNVIQVRVAEALKILVAIFPVPAFAGLMIGMVLANAFSPLGLIDLVSPAFAFVSLIPLYLLRRKGDAAVFTGAVIYCAGITTWVAFMLSVAYGLPYWITWVAVLAGQLIAVVGVGMPVYKVVKKAFPTALASVLPPGVSATSG